MGVMEDGAYADPNRDAHVSGTDSAGSVTRNGDLEAAKFQGAREHPMTRSSWKSRAIEHLKQDIDADKVSNTTIALV